tara:strand:+ start:169 stop:1380 length:1212 start_codon:yes stop_codon:yes gene_type:complete
MKILIVTPIYLPEQAPISFLLGETAAGLALKGHTVEVVTGIPSWLVDHNEGDFVSDFHVTELHGSKVYRLPYKKNKWNGLLSKLFGYFNFRFLLWRYKSKITKPDIIYGVIPSNETGMAIRMLARYFGCGYILNVQDIHPDAFFNLGLIKNSILKTALRNQERRMYRNASHITVIGDSFKTNLLGKGISVPIKVIPNWINPVDYELNSDGGLSAEWGINSSKFVILYSGTFGRIHGTSVILEAAEALMDMEDVLFLLVGHGVDFEKMRFQASERGLGNVVMKEYVPRERLAELQALSTVSLVTLLPKMGYSSIPSKILGYMAAGRPVIALTEKNSDTGKLVEQAKCGMVLPPGDASSLISTIKELLSKRGILADLGVNGRSYLKNYLDKEVLIDQIEDVLKRS